MGPKVQSARMPLAALATGFFNACFGKACEPRICFLHNHGCFNRCPLRIWVLLAGGKQIIARRAWFGVLRADISYTFTGPIARDLG